MTKKANAPHVEGSTEVLNQKQQVRTFLLTGLEDVPRSIIPVPFYKFVHPQTEKATLPDGKRAANGSFLMPDIRQAVNELRIVILRAKRSVRVQRQEDGRIEKVVSLQILAINLERQKPFILSVPITSFSAFGKIFEELETKGAKNAWDYPVYISSAEVEKPKETAQGLRNVTYWVVEAHLEPTPLSDEDKQTAFESYLDFAPKLDREENEDDLVEIAGKVFGEK
jgi:hypothetical protein